MKKNILMSAILSSSMLLAACGGGSSSSSGNKPSDSSGGTGLDGTPLGEATGGEIYQGDGPSPQSFDHVAVIAENEDPTFNPISLRTDIDDPAYVL